MIVVDASVLIAFLNPHDVHHDLAVELIESSTPPLVVHPVTAAEVLVAPARQGLADRVWMDLIAVGVQLFDGAIDPIELARIRVETGCKLPDCCVIATASALQIGVATFDDRLRKHSHGA